MWLFQGHLSPQGAESGQSLVVPGIKIGIGQELGFGFLGGLPGSQPLQHRGTVGSDKVLQRVLQGIAGAQGIREGMGGVELAAIDGINGQAQYLVDTLGDRQAAVLKGGYAVGGIGHGHIAGLHRELQVVFRLGEPFQKGNAGADLVLGARDDYHAGPLLDGHRLTA